MERRKFLIGAGALASGSAAAVGTGAFSRTSAARSVTVSTTGDSDAYLRLSGGQYANYNSNGVLEIELDDINANADVEFSDVFTIENQGDRAVGIFIDDNSYAFSGPAEQPSDAGADGLNKVLRDQGYNQNGWFDDEITSGEDINGPKALPSGYRSSSSNSANRTFNTAKDHILAPGQSISPDWYIFDTPNNPSNLDVSGEIVILAYSKDFVEAGKGP